LSLNNSDKFINKIWKQIAFFEFRKLVLPNFAQLMWVLGVLPNPVLTGVFTMVKTTWVKVANPVEISLRFNGHFPGEPGLAGVY